MSISKKKKYELANKLLQAVFLNDREKDILKMRLGLEGYVPSTLQEIGEKYGISRERVRQLGAAIAKKAKRNLPETKAFASKLFSKTWEPKYLAKERYLIRRRGVIKRNRTLVRNKVKLVRVLIDEFSITRIGKEKIAGVFKSLRIKYRRNKSLFDPDLVIEIKQLRQHWKEVKRSKPVPPNPPADVINPEL